MFEGLIGQFCIVRTESAGVQFGPIAEISADGRTVKIAPARRMWYWAGAASLSQAANEGVKAPEDCKFPPPTLSAYLTGVVEILPCTEVAILSLSNVKEWKV